MWVLFLKEKLNFNLRSLILGVTLKSTIIPTHFNQKLINNFNLKWIFNPKLSKSCAYIDYSYSFKYMVDVTFVKSSDFRLRNSCQGFRV